MFLNKSNHNPSMWRQRKPTVKIHDTSSPSSPFSFSTFKDINNLFFTDDPPSPVTPVAASPSKRASVFHRVRLATSILRSWPTFLQLPEPKPEHNEKTPDPEIRIPGAENRIVVYFTSLRVVRSTFEDCRAVRSILRGFRVQVDERDLAMDYSGFTSELRHIFGEPKTGVFTLPRVFIGGRYIGGAEEVRQLHEAGELKKYVEGLPCTDDNSSTGGRVCQCCGGYRFVLCTECNGSHKLYIEKSVGFKSCSACNENGLVRCPSCYSAPLV